MFKDNVSINYEYYKYDKNSLSNLSPDKKSVLKNIHKFTTHIFVDILISYLY